MGINDFSGNTWKDSDDDDYKGKWRSYSYDKNGMGYCRDEYGYYDKMRVYYNNVGDKYSMLELRRLEEERCRLDEKYRLEEALVSSDYGVIREIVSRQKRDSKYLHDLMITGISKGDFGLVQMMNEEFGVGFCEHCCVEVMSGYNDQIKLYCLDRADIKSYLVTFLNRLGLSGVVSSRLIVKLDELIEAGEISRNDLVCKCIALGNVELMKRFLVVPTARMLEMVSEVSSRFEEFKYLVDRGAVVTDNVIRIVVRHRNSRVFQYLVSAGKISREFVVAQFVDIIRMENSVERLLGLYEFSQSQLIEMFRVACRASNGLVLRLLWSRVEGCMEIACEYSSDVVGYLVDLGGVVDSRCMDVAVRVDNAGVIRYLEHRGIRRVSLLEREYLGRVEEQDVFGLDDLLLAEEKKRVSVKRRILNRKKFLKKNGKNVILSKVSF